MNKALINILLVEDDEAHVELIRRAFLARSGHAEIRVAASLTSARALLAESHPTDIVIIDWLLPDGKGIELLNDTGGEPTMPLILMTSHGDEHLAVEAMKAGALEYVVKSESVFADMPHTVESALRKWENILERRRAEKELERSAHMLRRVLVGTVQAMARMVETRDPYTAGHQRRVAHLAVSIATEMDLPQETIEGLQLGATIHDIGKNYIPAEILNRPGPLTDIEFELIKQHPQVGSDIVSEVDFPWPVAEMILQHHERMDGSGYPEGLSGDDIILEARILAVADVVEAMASHRPYRPACGMEAALAEIAANRAKAYDPEVADACLRLFKDRGYQLSAETYGNVETAAPIGVH